MLLDVGSWILDAGCCSTGISVSKDPAQCMVSIISRGGKNPFRYDSENVGREEGKRKRRKKEKEKKKRKEKKGKGREERREK